MRRRFYQNPYKYMLPAEALLTPVISHATGRMHPFPSGALLTPVIIHAAGYARLVIGRQKLRETPKSGQRQKIRETSKAPGGRQKLRETPKVGAPGVFCDLAVLTGRYLTTTLFIVEYPLYIFTPFNTLYALTLK